MKPAVFVMMEGRGGVWYNRGHSSFVLFPFCFPLLFCQGNPLPLNRAVAEPFQGTNRHTSSIWNLLELNGTELWPASLESCVLTGLFLTKMAAGEEKKKHDCSCAASESMSQLKERGPATSNREWPCDITKTRLLLEAEKTPTVMMQLWHHKWRGGGVTSDREG